MLQVGQEEADEVHKMLEEFRDEVNEEKVVRRVNLKRAASEGWIYGRAENGMTSGAEQAGWFAYVNSQGLINQPQPRNSDDKILQQFPQTGSRRPLLVC